MSNGEFFNSEQITSEYAAIAPAFISAFAGEPWHEVSTCIDDRTPKRCPNELSPTEVGETCLTCHNQPVKPAYTVPSVIENFKTHSSTYPTFWYLERHESAIAIAGYASLQNREGLVKSTYRRGPDMPVWLSERFGETSFTWLHEIFADTSVRANGNLKNFGAMCMQFSNLFETSIFAYCTKSPKMIATAKREFGNSTKVYEPHQEIPDHRYFVSIEL